MSLMEQELVDEMHLFQAMKILGDTQGKACFSGREVTSMRDAMSLRLGQATVCGEDLFLRLWPRKNSTTE